MLLYIQKQALQVDTCGAFFDILGLMLLILALLILFNRTDLITPIVMPFCIISVVYAVISSIYMS